jgi:hypothetical protein
MATKMSRYCPDPVPEQAGPVINWPRGSGSVIQESGSEKNVYRSTTLVPTLNNVPKEHFVSDTLTGWCLLIADGKNMSRTYAGVIESR